MTVEPPPVTLKLLITLITYERFGMSFAFSTNKFGHALPVPIKDPVEIARAADLLGYRPDEAIHSDKLLSLLESLF